MERGKRISSSFRGPKLGGGRRAIRLFPFRHSIGDNEQNYPGVLTTFFGDEVENLNDFLPGEPKTFIFGGYDPYIEGLKPSFFHGFGVQR